MLTVTIAAVDSNTIQKKIQTVNYLCTLHCKTACSTRLKPLTNPTFFVTESCSYHPGSPYFHDAYKGWSCCNKKSVDFTEFLNIKGCTLAKHSNVKPPEPEKPKNDANIEDFVEEKIPEPIKKSTLIRPAYNSKLIELEPKVNPAFKSQIDALPPSVTKQITRQELTIGTTCKNGGCNKSYEGPESDNEECVFHSGVPIFHEGMKYWSCCQRKTSDFTAFMNQEGCDRGSHKWFKDGNREEVKCRWDWHQTATNVVVSVYAKMYDYRSSFVKVNPIRLVVELVFPQQNNNKFLIDIELRGIIKVEEANVTMYGTKVEITLPKAEPGSWSRLDVAKKVQKIEAKKPEAVENNEESDSDVDLDGIEAITGVQISEVK